MNFLVWLKNQDKRKDTIGWLSRLISTSDSSCQEIQAFSGQVSITKYAESLSDGKIKRSLIDAIGEWMKIASAPLVGIFWEYKGEIIDFSVDARTTSAVAGFRDSPYDHYVAWDQMQKLYPELRDKGYDEIPRGRVIGKPDGAFRLFLSPEEVSNQVLINKIMKVFQLPREKTEVVGDEHYSLNFDPFDEED